MNYSLLVMESAGMMKMDTGEGSPSGRVPEQGPDWFLVATEACGGGTPDQDLFLEVLGFIGGVGVGNKSRGPTTRRQGWSTLPGGRVHPPPLWLTRDSSGPTLLLLGLLLVHKKSP